MYEADIRRVGEAKVNAAIDIICKGLGKDQVQAIKSFGAMTGGVTLINGMGGTGKSHIIHNTCGYFYLTGDKEVPGTVHVLPNTNGTIDQLARKIHAYLLWLYELLKDTEWAIPYPIVVRRYEHNGDKEVSRKAALTARNEGQQKLQVLTNPDEATQAALQLKVLSIDLMIYQGYMSKQEALEHGVHDKRIKEMDLSLGTLVLGLGGYVDSEGKLHPRRLDPKVHPEVNDFRLYTNRFAKGEDLTEEELQKWSLAYNSIALKGMQMSDVIVESGQNFLEQRHHNDWRIRATIFDEAAKAPEVEVVGAIVYAADLAKDKDTVYPPVILLGDTQQPRPVQHILKTQEVQEPFRHQEALSLFTRLIFCDFKPINFRHQYRFIEDIARPLEACGYVGITTDDSSSVELAPLAAVAKTAWAKIFNGTSQRFFVWNEGASEQSQDAQTSSLANERYVNLVFYTLARLELEGIPANRVAIVTPYNFELTSLAAMQQVAIEQYQKQTGPHAARYKQGAENLQGLTLTTADNLKGGQADIIMFIVPDATGLSFLIETARIVMAISRGRSFRYDGILRLSINSRHHLV